MKKLIFTLAALTVVALPVFPALDIKAGPRKGRLLELEAKNAEFFVEKDRTISIAFYDAAMKQVALTTEVVSATAEAPSGKTKLEFAPKGGLLVSKAPLPEGEGYQIVVQVKPTTDAKPKNFRIKLELYTCKECGNPEYACTCDE